MADAQIRAVITAKDEASSVISHFSKSSAAAFGAIAGIAQGLTTRAIDVLSESIGDATKRVDTLNNSSRVFANMGFEAGAVKGAMDHLKDSILGLPTPLDSAVRGMQMIASTTPDINRAQGIFTALNDAVIGFGGTTEMVDGAVLQLSQAFSNGRVDAQTWNSMMQNGLGPTLNAIAKQMGMTTGQLKEGLSTGQVSVQQFQDALISLDKNGGGGLKSLHTIAKDATAGIGTGIENAKTAIARGMGDIISAIGADNISNAISNVGAAFETGLSGIGVFIANLIAKFKEWWPTIEKVANSVMAFLWPSLKALWDTLSTQLGPSLLKLFDAIKPLLPVIGVLLVGAIWLLINGINIVAKIMSWWIDNVLTPLYTFFLKTLPDAITKAVNWIVDKVTYMKDHFWETVGFVIGFFALLPIKIPFYIGQMLASIVDMIAKINWGDVLSGLWKAIVGLWNNIYSGFRGLMDKIIHLNWGDVGKSIGNALIGLLEGAINGALHGLPSAPKVHLPRFAEGVQNFGGGLAIVGERGPELVNLPSGSDVIPNHKLGGGVVNVNVNVGVYAGSEQEKRRVAQDLFAALQDVANSRNTTVANMLGGV